MSCRVGLLVCPTCTVGIKGLSLVGVGDDLVGKDD